MIWRRRKWKPKIIWKLLSRRGKEEKFPCSKESADAKGQQKPESIHQRYDNERLIQKKATSAKISVIPVVIFAQATELSSAVRAENFIAYNAQVQTKCLQFSLF